MSVCSRAQQDRPQVHKHLAKHEEGVNGPDVLLPKMSVVEPNDGDPDELACDTQCAKLFLGEMELVFQEEKHAHPARRHEGAEKVEDEEAAYNSITQDIEDLLEQGLAS